MSSLGSFFGKDEKNSSTLNTSTTDYTDKSANSGGQGSIAAAENATVGITNITENLGADVALGAIGANEATSRAAIEGAAKQTEFVVNSLTGLSETAARQNSDTRNSADLALQTTAGLLSALQGQTGSALERAQAPEAASVKAILTPILWAIGALALAFIIFTGRKSSKK